MKKTEAKKKTVKKTSVKSVTKTPSVKKPAKSAPVNTTLLEDKDKIIEKFAQRKGDTGSPEVQIALLSHKIIKLSGHLDINKKDNHSRRGLLKVIAKRRRILNYLQKLDEKRYKSLIKELGLKR
ncbi:MAG: 30S ribosomal protein S15 [Candidatus Roizmanbacteria bacterium GW2011_GWA2_35_19]|uniref:Small ribosomal subunit protein uS15 n=2 Tax=Candidatus Roizmaniibacteriota TaxID=1752723 RepID=A0A0G0EF26_9BACT|nr:MAG: 30S ribosomal protein S15 [Candidatus Roizmanbacteria bacterium GW2011_GWA2_35_19]